jgi:small subunit ribosomal protein S4e
MDVISIPKVSAYLRILLNKKGKLFLLPISKEEASIKPCKIRGKKLIKGKTQLNLFDGKNILVDKDNYKVGDTIIIELPSQKIKEHIAFQKGNLIYLIGGKHTGDVGLIEDIKGNRIVYKKDKSTFETLKEYAFVIGKEKSVILLEK